MPVVLTLVGDNEQWAVQFWLWNIMGSVCGSHPVLQCVHGLSCSSYVFMCLCVYVFMCYCMLVRLS
jgi:hypothetical protein